MRNINEGVSSDLRQLKKICSFAQDLYGKSSRLVGAVGEDEIQQMVENAILAANWLVSFADDIIRNVDESFVSDKMNSTLTRMRKTLSEFTGPAVSNESKNLNVDSDIYIDPYESEYLPESMLSESIKEDAEPLPVDMDDDPDAIYTTDTDGMPVKFNNTPLDLDPFAVKLFRNNAELIDPPEVYNAVSGAEDSVEPDIVPGDADGEIVDSAASEEFIDVVADGSENGDPAEKEKKVDLPVRDFDVFANESKNIPKCNADGLPPQFNSDVKRTNANIASDPANNLKMLEFLTHADI